MKSCLLFCDISFRLRYTYINNVHVHFAQFITLLVACFFIKTLLAGFREEFEWHFDCERLNRKIQWISWYSMPLKGFKLPQMFETKCNTTMRFDLHPSMTFQPQKVSSCWIFVWRKNESSERTLCYGFAQSIGEMWKITYTKKFSFAT